jgi:hypothetical protein
LAAHIFYRPLLSCAAENSASWQHCSANNQPMVAISNLSLFSL